MDSPLDKRCSRCWDNLAVYESFSAAFCEECWVKYGYEKEQPEKKIGKVKCVRCNLALLGPPSTMETEDGPIHTWCFHEMKPRFWKEGEMNP